MKEDNIEELDGVNISNELRSIREIVKDLSKPVAKRHLRKRKQGGKEIYYLAWHDAINISTITLRVGIMKFGR